MRSLCLKRHTLFPPEGTAAAGLISAEQRGRTICYRAEFVAMNELVAYLTENCYFG